LYSDFSIFSQSSLFPLSLSSIFPCSISSSSSSFTPLSLKNSSYSFSYFPPFLLLHLSFNSSKHFLAIVPPFLTSNLLSKFYILLPTLVLLFLSLLNSFLIIYSVLQFIFIVHLTNLSCIPSISLLSLHSQIFVSYAITVHINVSYSHILVFHSFSQILFLIPHIWLIINELLLFSFYPLSALLILRFLAYNILDI